MPHLLVALRENGEVNARLSPKSPILTSFQLTPSPASQWIMMFSSSVKRTRLEVTVQAVALVVDELEAVQNSQHDLADLFFE